ncbi:MAG: hypothetical protein WAS21_32515 [Geminicoccaceae bacterium]
MTAATNATRLSPSMNVPVRDFFGRDRGKIVIHGDLDDLEMDGEMRG